MLEMNVIVSGNVQGIGFRRATQLLAESMKIAGFVRNLENGSVEICAQGKKEQLDVLVESIKKKFSTYIQDVKIIFHTAQILFEDFRIQR